MDIIEKAVQEISIRVAVTYDSDGEQVVDLHDAVHALADAGMLIDESVPERCVCGTELVKCISCGDDRCPRCDPGECRPESDGGNNED